MAMRTKGLVCGSGAAIAAALLVAGFGMGDRAGNPERSRSVASLPHSVAQTSSTPSLQRARLLRVPEPERETESAREVPGDATVRRPLGALALLVLLLVVAGLADRGLRVARCRARFQAV